MEDIIDIIVTETTNLIEITSQPNDEIIDVNIIDNREDITLNVTPSVVEININSLTGNFGVNWGDIEGTLSNQTDLQNVLNAKADLVDGKVPSSQLPSYVDDVVEVANYASLPVTGEVGKIYITLDTNFIYRWSGSTYIEIKDSSAVWGAITGTLSSQTDLQSALDAKVPYTGATGNVNLGEYGATVGYLGFDTTPTSTPTGIGTTYWDSFYRTLSLIDGDGDTTLQIGQEQRVLVHNNTGSTLTDGQVVYVIGSTGELPSVALASNTSETTSSVTFGIVTESIAHGANGFITTSGIIHGLNTNAYDEGAAIYLGSTAGTFTQTKPVAPANSVLVGYIIKKSGGNGSIFVKIQNGYELEELHDVLITSKANNDGLFYESSTSLWKNKSIATVLGYTPANDSLVVHNTGNESISGVKTFTTQLAGAQLRFSESGGFGNVSGYTQIGGTADYFNFVNGGNTKQATFNYGTGGSGYTYTLPNSNGTLALTSQLSSYLPLSGGTLTGALSGTSATFSGNVGVGTASPSDRLNVVVGSNGNAVRFDGPTSGLIFQTNATTTDIISYGGSTPAYRALNFSASASTNMTITTSGNVGIGTTSPTDYTGYTTLHLNGKSGANGGLLRLTASDNSSSVNIYAGGSAINFNTTSAVPFVWLTQDTERMRITSSGSVLVGTTDSSGLEKMLAINSTNNAGYKISVNGSVRGYVFADASTYYIESANSTRIRVWVNSANGVYLDAGNTSWTSNSDERLKTALTPITDALNKVSQLRSVIGRFKTDEESVKRSFLIAQDVQSVLPEAINIDKETGMLGVQYTEVIPLLVASIKELKAELDALKA